MAKMTEEELLQFLDAEADAARQHATGRTATERTQAVRDYMRAPYGNEEEGRSSVVASDVFDAVEGMLPDLVEVFVSTDEAVRFDPVGAEDEEGAKQATESCNHVFYKQNNGFLTLYSVAKDALLLKTGGVKWYWEEKRTPSFTTMRGSPMQIAMHLMTNPRIEVLSQEEGEPDPQTGEPTLTVRLKSVETKGKVKICPVPADELRVSRAHNSVLLDECPYVAHVAQKTKSDIKQMGYTVSDEDMKAAQNEELSTDRELFDILNDESQIAEHESTDPAQVSGWLREEYVLVDVDGDGIAERRRIMRLGRKVLENVECSHVQIAAWTPYILTHRFQGLSVAELVSDFQRIQTEIVRQSLDNLALANNNETVVFSPGGVPQANIDDLLNRRAGGVIREMTQGAVRAYNEHWKGIESAPMVEMLHSAKENRTGFTRYSQGLDSNSLNKTATGVTLLTNASQKRMKLMARIMAEALVAPMFRGIFKTLSDYCMEKLAFRLNGKFVAYDPQEWRDGYDMSINVGIGSGDKMQQMQMLGGIEAAQAAAIQGGGMGLLVTPMNIYNLQKRKVELAGFKDANEFWTQPPEQMPQPPAPPPDPKVQLDGAKLEADQQKFQATQQAEAQKFQADATIKTQEAEKDRLLQVALKQMDQQFQVWLKQNEQGRADHEAMSQPEAEDVTADQMAQMLTQSVDMIAQKIDGAKPESVEKVRDKAGKMIGARITQADGAVREVTIQ